MVLANRLCFTEHLRWFSVAFQDLWWCVFHDFPGPCMVDRSTSFITRSTLPLWHCYRILYKLLCHFVTNVPVVTKANVFTNSTKFRMWPKYFHCLVIIQTDHWKMCHTSYSHFNDLPGPRSDSRTFQAWKMWLWNFRICTNPVLWLISRSPDNPILPSSDNPTLSYAKTRTLWNTVCCSPTTFRFLS